MKKREEQTIKAIWCVHSETGEHYLIDLYTNRVVAKATSTEWLKLNKEKKHENV